MEKISLSSSIKSFVIENEEGRELAVLKLDTSNDKMFARLMDLYDGIDDIRKKLEKRAENVSNDNNEITFNDAKEILSISDEAINDVIAETDKLFGDGFTHKIFIEHYEADPEFIPNIQLFTEFYTKILPIIQSVYKNSLNNYSVKKGGKAPQDHEKKR